MSDEGPSPRHGPPQALSSGSGRTNMTAWRQPYLHEPISSKHVCFYKSGDTQFSGLPVVINNRTFKTFESLLDSLSRRVPLPFGVRHITTPRGHTTVRSLDQLHHGHSYICSDQRTVKPVDLERARRRPPPWYHARPASGPRRKALTKQRVEIRPRRRRHGRGSTPHLLSTPKRLVVFRNGEPEEKHTLLLQKRNARSFEALLDYVSEVMHFPVVKLYMPDGRRVDGLPALILCFGVLVAAGREPFKAGYYDIQRPTAPTWLPAKRAGTKWVHPSRRKKKSGSSSLKSRIFSPSSERFFVNQIHHSAAGSGGEGDFPSVAAGSEEMENSNALCSLAGTDILTYGEGTGDAQALPDDDIEKSFRVNQDGSMTVEMKVRLTIKEEETVHWTTTLSRSAVTNQMRESSDTGLLDSSHLPLDTDHDPEVAAMETSDWSQDFPPPMKNDVTEDSDQVEEEKQQGGSAQVLSPLARRVPTPGPRKVRQMRASSVEDVVQQGPEAEVQEDRVGSYSYREEKQEYCMVRQTSSRPVPKPRSTNVSETNKAINSSTSVQSQYKSAEVLQVGDSGQEIRETVVHIYEQQTCQDNFLANTQLRVQGVSTYSPLYNRPASAGTVRNLQSSSMDWESEQNRYIARKLNGRGKPADNLSMSSNLNTPPCQTSVGTDNCSTAVLGEKMSDSNQQTPENNGDPQSLTRKRKPVTWVFKKNSHVFQSTTSEKKRREHIAEILRGIRKRRNNNPGTSVGPVKIAERLRAKTAQKLLKKRQKMRAAEYDVPVSDKSSPQPAEIITQAKENHNELSKVKEAVTEDKKAEKSETPNVPQKSNALEVEGLQGKAVLIRQTSMHEDRRTTRVTAEMSESVSLPALTPSSSMINEYVEQWLLTSHHDALSDMEEDPPCSIGLNSESASQTGDETRALFQISSDREASPEIGCEMIHMTEDPSGDALPASLPSLVVQLSQNTQSSLEAAEPTLPTAELKQSHEKDLSRSNGSVTGTPTVERNATPKKSNVAKEIQPCHVPEERLSSQNVKDLPTPKPLPRGNTLEKKQPLPSSDDRKIPLPRNPNTDKSPSRSESQRKTINNNQTPRPRQKTLEEEAPLHSSASLKPNPLSPLVENTQVVTKSSSDRNTASCDSHRKNNGQAINSITFPPQLEETERKAQTPTVVPVQRSYTVRMAARPDMKPVVEQLCLSIHSIKETAQQKRPSCLEKSNSLPDFSSHIASTFGSSSRVLLAFLSVMALKDGLANLNSNKQGVIDNLSYSEALRLLDSLRELARIEDAHVLRESLTALQNSISRHLLQSWRGFQELSDQARSRSVTPSSSESEGPPDVGPEEEKVIQELMGDLGVPEKVREGLAALYSAGEKGVREQATIKETPFLQLREETVIKDQASQFQNVKMKFNEKIAGGNNNPQKIPEKQTVTQESVGEGYPKNTVTVQQSDEYFKEESNSQESVESYHKELDVEESRPEEMTESLPELSLNGFTEPHPMEDTASLADSALDEDVSVHIKSAISQTPHDPQYSVFFSSSNPMPNPSADEEGQPDSECQFTYMDSQAEEHLAQSKAESDIHAAELSEEEGKSSQEEILLEAQKENDERESKGVEIADAENEEEEEEEDVIPTEEEAGAVEPQHRGEEENTPSSDDKFSLEEDEDEEDICEELMGLSEEPVAERDKLSETETQQATLVGVEYITNSNLTSLTQGREHEKMDKTKNKDDEQGPGLSQTGEPPAFQSHKEKPDGGNTDNETTGKVYPSHKKRPSSPIEQHFILDNPECYSIYQEGYLAEMQWATEEMISHRTTSFLYPEERTTSVGRLISNLEEQPRPVELKVKKTPTRSRNEHSRSHIEVPEVSENDDLTSVSHLSDEQTKIEEFMVATTGAKRSPSVKEIRETIMNNTSSKLLNTTRSSPVSRVTSPLAFSYDSRSRDSEGSPQTNKVKSIREMFLAKSSSDSQFVQRRQPSPFRCDRSDSRPGSSDPGATGSQNSQDISSAEEDTGRLAIAKGYVRKTIERLYGRAGGVKASEANRPLSASKGKRKEAIVENTVKSLAAFHEARSRVISDLSYFNATSSFDVITEPTQCIAMNAQVSSQNAVLIDEGRWLMREKHPLQTTRLMDTPSDTNSPPSDCESVSSKSDGKEVAPYSHFSSVKTHNADTVEPVVPDCTYLTLPHGGDDSEPDEDDPCAKAADTSKKKRDQKVSPITEQPKTRSERNGVLPAFIPEFKRGDNKVHPLMDLLPLKPPVMAQPSKRQATQMGVTQPAEPDFLELLYVTCGEHCPFL